MTKLWLVSRTDQVWYDGWDSMVVAADTEEEARFTHPSGYVGPHIVEGRWSGWVWLSSGDAYHSSGWGNVDTLTVEYLGTTDRDIKGVVLASFNAG